MKRCYEILEIQSDTTPDEAKQAFRDLVNIWHPDKFCHNPRLMEKADRKLKEINWAWEQYQGFLREQEKAAEERRQREYEEAARQREQREKKLMVLSELRPIDIDLESVVSVDHARQAYHTRFAGAKSYDPDPGLSSQEEWPVSPVSKVSRGYDLLKKAVSTHVQHNPEEHESLIQSVQSRGLAGKIRAHDADSESTTEINRKMQLLSEYYVQGRREMENNERHERNRLKRVHEESEEKAHNRQKQMHRLFSERYLEKYRIWLAEEKEKFSEAEREKLNKTGVYRFFRGVERQKEFPYGIPLIRMIFIHGGTFAMGKDSKSSLFRKILGTVTSHPRHPVTIRDFYLSKFPVTEKQWSRAMGVPTPEISQDFPIQLNWSNVEKFINRLNEITGLRFRLPTEAEWEYAARSGGKDEKWPGENEGSVIFDHASVGRGEVGLRQANALGLHDMLGNVGEWSGDWYDPKYYASGVELDPAGPEHGDRKVIRGNIIFDAVGNPMIADSFSRDVLPVTMFNRAGFRLAHSLL